MSDLEKIRCERRLSLFVKKYVIQISLHRLNDNESKNTAECCRISGLYSYRFHGIMYKWLIKGQDVPLLN